jgi:hypothetical protein
MKKAMLFLAFAVLISCKSDYERAKELFDRELYSHAILGLVSIGPKDKDYINAQLLLAQIDSIKLVQAHEKMLFDSIYVHNNTKDQLLKVLKNNFLDTTIKEYENLESLKSHISLLEELGVILQNCEMYSDLETINLCTEVKPKLIKKQIVEFPIIRREMGRIIGDKLWRENISVSVLGSNYVNMIFVGGIFASNANIEDFNKEIASLLVKARFQKSTYKWIPSGDSKGYSFNVKSDSDL